jgi:hypothetical protein
MPRGVEALGRFFAGEADRGEQIGPAHVADEQSVEGEDAVGHRVAGLFVDHDAHRLGGVAGSVAKLQCHASQ